MITIGICDDQNYIVDILNEKIEICISEHFIQAEFLKFYSGKELLDCGQQIDLLFLDIDMPETDGIETGIRFRNKNKDCKIVMTSVRSDRMKEAFLLEAYRFITKPFDDAEIREAIDSFVKGRVGWQKILLYDRRKAVEIYQHQIMLIQTFDSYTEFTVGTNVLRSEKSLKELEMELDGRLFARVDKKYIVNFKNIDRFENGMVLILGKQIKVSRRRLRGFEEHYREFDLRYR